MAQIINRGNNRWLVRVHLGRDASGKRMHRNHTIKGTKNDAQEWARKTETDVSAGTYREPTRETVAEYLTAWLDGAAKLSVRPQTLASYRKTLLRFVVPRVGQKRLAQLALADVDRTYATMVEQGLSPRTVRYTHAVLRCALRKAVKARKLDFNPTDDATLPRAVAHERRNVGRDVAAKLLEAAAGDRWHALVLLFGATPAPIVAPERLAHHARSRMWPRSSSITAATACGGSMRRARAIVSLVLS